MYCMHAQKGASEAPRTRFRACKTSKFSGGVPPDPPCTIYVWAPFFVFALGPSHPLGSPGVRNRGILLYVYKQNISSLTIRRAFINQHLAIAMNHRNSMNPSIHTMLFNVSLYTHYICRDEGFGRCEVQQTLSLFRYNDSTKNCEMYRQVLVLFFVSHTCSNPAEVLGSVGIERLDVV